MTEQQFEEIKEKILDLDNKTLENLLSDSWISEVSVNMFTRGIVNNKIKNISLKDLQEMETNNKGLVDKFFENLKSIWI